MNFNPPQLLPSNQFGAPYHNHNAHPQYPPPMPPNNVMGANGKVVRRRRRRTPASISKLNRPLTRFYCNDCKKKFRSRFLANRNNNAVQHYCSLYGKIITRKVGSHSNKCKGSHGMGPCVMKRLDEDADSDGEDQTKAAYYADKGKTPRTKKQPGPFSKGKKRKRNELFDANGNALALYNNDQKRQRMDQPMHYYPPPSNNLTYNGPHGPPPPPPPPPPPNSYYNYGYHSQHYYNNNFHHYHHQQPPPTEQQSTLREEDMNANLPPPIDTAGNENAPPLPIQDQTTEADFGDVPPPPALEPICGDVKDMEIGSKNETESDEKVKENELLFEEKVIDCGDKNNNQIGITIIDGQECKIANGESNNNSANVTMMDDDEKEEINNNKKNKKVSNPNVEIITVRDNEAPVLLAIEVECDEEEEDDGKEVMSDDCINDGVDSDDDDHDHNVPMVLKNHSMSPKRIQEQDRTNEDEDEDEEEEVLLAIPE